MSTQEGAPAQIEPVDLTIARGARALMAWHRIPVEGLAAAVHTSKSTIERRLKMGGWTAREVAAVAWAFDVPIADLYIGKVELGSSKWLGPAPTTPSPLPRGGRAERQPTFLKVRHLSPVPSQRLHCSGDIGLPQLSVVSG